MVGRRNCSQYTKDVLVSSGMETLEDVVVVGGTSNWRGEVGNFSKLLHGLRVSRQCLLGTWIKVLHPGPRLNIPLQRGLQIRLLHEKTLKLQECIHVLGSVVMSTGIENHGKADGTAGGGEDLLPAATRIAIICRLVRTEDNVVDDLVHTIAHTRILPIGEEPALEDEARDPSVLVTHFVRVAHGPVLVLVFVKITLSGSAPAARLALLLGSGSCGLRMTEEASIVQSVHNHGDIAVVSTALDVLEFLTDVMTIVNLRQSCESILALLFGLGFNAVGDGSEKLVRNDRTIPMAGIFGIPILRVGNDELSRRLLLMSQVADGVDGINANGLIDIFRHYSDEEPCRFFA
mmetsp:Transcript_17534/g.50188  ORF Transcript_17534/g.50188 Transcript_17534/m.50188 type:complete len:347 (+) Transcript_17534:3606-4646(+)